MLLCLSKLNFVQLKGKGISGIDCVMWWEECFVFESFYVVFVDLFDVIVKGYVICKISNFVFFINLYQNVKKYIKILEFINFNMLLFDRVY